MKGKVKRKVIAWVLSFALVMGTVLGVPGLFMKAHAADAGVLYIIDSIGGTPESVTEDCTDSLVARQGASWTNPCKNLTNTHLYCEL